MLIKCGSAHNQFSYIANLILVTKQLTALNSIKTSRLLILYLISKVLILRWTLNTNENIPDQINHTLFYIFRLVEVNGLLNGAMRYIVELGMYGRFVIIEGPKIGANYFWVLRNIFVI